MFKAPHHQVNEPHVNHNSIDDFNNMNAALNETVNTEAFSNSKSELITSSPNHTSHIIERDATIIKVSSKKFEKIHVSRLTKSHKLPFFFTFFRKH